MEDKEDKWDDYIEGTLFTLNTNKSATTKYSPFFLMFGRNPRLPFEVEKTEQSSFTTSGDVAQVMHDLGSEEAITAHVNEMSQMRDSLFPQVNENIKRAQAKQQQQYQKKRAKQNGCPFKVGDLVLQRNMLQKTKAGYKYQDQWLGPYQITEINAEKGTCRLAKKCGKKIAKQMSFSNLKPYRFPRKHESGDSNGQSPSSSTIPRAHTSSQAPPVPKPRTKLGTRTSPVPEPRNKGPANRVNIVPSEQQPKPQASGLCGSAVSTTNL